MINNFKPNQETLNRLNELETVSKILEDNSIFYSVIGGFAVDGHKGRLTRNHDDLDMLCHKEEADLIKWFLGKQSFQFLDKSLPLESVFYKFYNKEGTLTFNIVKKLNGNFNIAFWYLGHLQYPNSLLTRKKVIIDNVSFYVINKELLIDLKNKQCDFEYHHLDNPNHERKYLDCLHDLEILKNN